MPSSMVRAHPELPEPTPGDAALIAAFLRSKRAQSSRPAAVSTANTYRLAVSLLARWGRSTGRAGLMEMTRADLEDYVIWMRETARTRAGKPFASGYVNNQYRALRSFYTWLVNFDDVRASKPRRMAAVAAVRSSQRAHFHGRRGRGSTVRLTDSR
ncbi:MAG TPA: hypothetical protein VFT95_01130 [Micromonosporaceae bacterium]|nr:hypothetical protein [Micromonosporaceae bacterium]